jgi:hypothetical protein
LFNNIKNGNDSSCCWFFCQEIWLQLYAWKNFLASLKMSLICCSIMSSNYNIISLI